MSQSHVYPLGQRPAAHVLIERSWYACEVRMVHADGRLNVAWRRDGDTYLDNFEASQVRYE